MKPHKNLFLKTIQKRRNAENVTDFSTRWRVYM